MDSEHRHELKTNELADWLGHLPDYVRKNYMQIIGVVVIIIALLTWKPLTQKREKSQSRQDAKATAAIEQLNQNKMMSVQSAMQGMETLETMIVSANTLDIEAKDASNPLIGALALIKRGEALRADLHYRSGQVEEGVITSQVQQARDAYNKALEKANGNAMLTGMAKFGLGLCSEEVGEFDKAKEIYQSIASDEAFEGTVFPAQAKFRLDNMSDNQEKFQFAKAPEPVETEMSLPAVESNLGPLQDETSETNGQ